MGGYYTNITLHHVDRDAVMHALHEAARDAFVSPVENGSIVVFDEITDRTCGLELDELSTQLSKDLRCAALAVSSADGSNFAYWVHVEGERVDGYEASPNGIDGGDADQLCRAFAARATRDEVESILRRHFVIQTDRHQALTSALGLPDAAVGLGYEHLLNEAQHLQSTFGEFVKIVPESPSVPPVIGTGLALPWKPGDVIPAIAGLGLGHTREDVIALLGDPSHTTWLGPVLDMLWYDAAGVEVLLREEPSSVRAISVCRRGGPDLNGVHVGDSWSSVRARWGEPTERWTGSMGDAVVYEYHVATFWTLSVTLDKRHQRVLRLGIIPASRPSQKGAPAV